MAIMAQSEQELLAIIKAKDETIAILKEIILHSSKIEPSQHIPQPREIPAEDIKPKEPKFPPIYDDNENSGQGGYRKMTEQERLDYLGTFREVTGFDLN